MPTLALNVIVGPNDYDVLDRCLESCKGTLFDQLIVVDASPEPTQQTKDVCKKHNAQYFYFKWIDDFSAARNYCLDQTTTDFMMWLDSDDVIKPDAYQKLLEIKPRLNEVDQVLLDYNYAHDPQDKPILVLPRERIVRRIPEIRWHDCIHEYMNNYGRQVRFKIPIDHYRKPFDPTRNTRLLEKLINSGNYSPRNLFYYAKELFDTCNPEKQEKSIAYFKEYLEKGYMTDSLDNQAVTCIKLAEYYDRKLDHKNAKLYAIRSIGLVPRYAEPYYYLGILYEQSELWSEFHKQALTKNLDGGLGQMTDYYGFLPARLLAIIYYQKGNIQEAQRYLTIALSHKPNDPECLNLKALIGNIEVKVCWLIPGNLDITNGSFRIRRWALHNKLPGSTMVERYLDHPIQKLLEFLKDYNVIIFSNFCAADLALMYILRLHNKIVVFDHCEGIWGFPYQHECMQMANVITCCSTKLAEITLQKGYKLVAVIPDPIEEVAKEELVYENKEKLKAGFFGMGGNSWLVTSWLKDSIEEAGYELVNCTEWDDATIKWDLNTWPQEMQKCDVILCPQRTDIQPAKSNNKVTQAMYFGLPVICSPLQAYTEVVKHDVNGYIANTQQEWKDALIKLKDPETRKRIGQAGQASISDYKLETIASNWQTIFRNLLTKQDVPQQPQQEEPIDIIIPNYNNFAYLRLCLDSILLNTNVPYRIIISDAGSNSETWQELKALKGFTILGSQEKRLTFSQACNEGIKISRSKYFVILNSDTIVSKNWLSNMLKNMTTVDRLASCGVLSNCDLGWRHGTPTTPYYEMNGLHPGMKIEEIKPKLDDLYAFMERSNIEHRNKFTLQDWNAAYCTLYARSAIDEVGLFDDIYQNGVEDLDLERRLHLFGFKSGQAIDAFVFHYGGISRGAYQLEDIEHYNEEDKINHEKYRNKWNKKKIVIWTGPAWEPWDKKKVEEGMAGSETWAVYLAQEFAKQNYDVYLFNHRQDPETVYFEDGVYYIDHTKMEQALQYQVIDYFIASRSIEPLKLKTHALKNYVMIHDIWLHPDRNYDLQQWKVNKFLYLSQWHKEFLQAHHKIPDNKLLKTANGIMPLYEDVDIYEKSNIAIYSSSPDRGLYQLLQMVPAIRKEVPDFHLYIAYGFHNWESMAKQRNDIQGLEFIEKIKKAMEQPGVTYLGRISKKELATYEKRAKAWLYPTWFTETFCITAASAGAAKCAILTTNLGALSDTVGDAGILLPSDGLTRNEAYPESYVAQFVEQAIKLYKDENYRHSWATRAYEKMKPYKWDKIATELLKEFEI